MTIAEKLAQIAENEQAVYNKGVADGKQNDYDTFWDALQNEGTLTDYNYTFAGWKASLKAFFKPKYSMTPTRSYQMFYSNYAIEDLPALCEECDVTLSFSNSTSMDAVFYNCLNLTHLGTINTTNATNLGNMCGACIRLETVDNLILKADGTQTMPSCFNRCLALKNITITGTIGTSGLSFKDSEGLTAASLTSILTALTKDSTTASGKSITFATASQAIINANTAAKAQFDAAVAAGWTIAFA